MLKVLGISFGFHDAAASIVVDGQFIAGSEEERFSRIKHDNSFPINAIAFCLKQACMSIDDIDAVVYYEENLLKLDRIVSSAIINNEKDYFEEVLTSWANGDKLNIQYLICSKLGIAKEKIHSIEHHLSHASSAYYQSGFNEAAVLAIDGVGEYETLSIYRGDKLELTKLHSVSLPHSIGLFYSAYTSFLGFEVNEGEYKVMGMAAYGKPTLVDKVLQTIHIQEDGRFEIDLNYFEFLTPNNTMLKKPFFELFGEARASDMPFFTNKYREYAPKRWSEEKIAIEVEKNTYYANLAASVQKVAEDLIVKNAKLAMKLAGSENLCVSGGVALNSLANGRIRRELKPTGFFVQPAAGDSGSSLGAALYYTHTIMQFDRRQVFETALIGKMYTQEEIVCDIEENAIEDRMLYQNKADFFEQISILLCEKNVIGWHSGRFEWGPRALGARSILADPRDESMKTIVNEKIKFRELFRPFAPAVLAEEASQWFDLEYIDSLSEPENFMIAIAYVKEEKKHLIPAVVHADGTARVQLVRKESNPDFYDLIAAFYKKSGVPVLLNTSFNLKGEPIVNTPKDALLSFSYSDMDYLAIYPYIVKSYWKV